MKTTEKRARTDEAGTVRKGGIDAAVTELVDSRLRSFRKATRAGINKAVEAAVAKREHLALQMLRDRDAAVRQEDIGKVDRKKVEGMIGELYKRLSGAGSEGENYTFMTGSQAALLNDVRIALREGNTVSKEEADAVTLIYEKFLPNGK